MSPGADPNPFEADASDRGGYAYTTDAPLSARLANRRLTEVSLALGDFDGARVIDVGCGDGTYSDELLEVAAATSVHGVDPAPAAIEIARRRSGDPRLSFDVASAYEIPADADSFDVAYLRGVLHHLDRPLDALREAFRVAPRIVVVEPNGYNPGLKLLERVSRYHREHEERSYPPRRLDRWVEQAGGRVTQRFFAGFVPMFSPDWVARTMKRVEPLLERTPAVRAGGCAVYVFAAERRDD